MDTLIECRTLIRRIILSHTEVPYAHGEIEFEPVFDSERDRYLLMLVGRDRQRRIHGCLIHVDIIDGKFWIQRDGTEVGIANQLVAAGIPNHQIVLGFRLQEYRSDTEFAIM